MGKAKQVYLTNIYIYIYSYAVIKNNNKKKNKYIHMPK